MPNWWNLFLCWADSRDMMRRSFELGTQLGGHRRAREILAWSRSKHWCQIARQDLIAYVCERSPPPQTNRLHHRTAQTSAYTRASSRLSGLEPTSPRFGPVVGARSGSYYVPGDPPDFATFKDALALQGCYYEFVNSGWDFLRNWGVLLTRLTCCKMEVVLLGVHSFNVMLKRQSTCVMTFEYPNANLTFTSMTTL